MSIIQGTSKAAGGAVYEIDQSIRFNQADSARLIRTPASVGNRKTFTFSCWLKRGNISTNAARFFTGYQDVNNQFEVYFNTSDSLVVAQKMGGTWYEKTTDAKYRDPSAWYHFVWYWDTTDSTASDRSRAYINGERVSFASGSDPSLNADGMVNATIQHEIAGEQAGSTYYYDGYLAEINFIDGTALDPTSFGETNDDGVWIPKAYDGSYGTNGFYITGATASDLGEDFSGNGNDFTSSGLATTDQMLDTPTLNFCTWNPLKTNSSATLSDGNLNYTASGAQRTTSTFAVNSGKWYAEFTISAATGSQTWGVVDIAQVSLTDAYIGQRSYEWGIDGLARTWNNGSNAANYTDFSASDVIGIALDMDNGKVWFRDNDGTFLSGGDPAAGTTPDFSGLSGDICFAAQFTGGNVTINCGQSAYTNAPPTGFNALNTANLPNPTIALPEKYFNTVLYEGNGGGQRVGQFQPITETYTVPNSVIFNDDDSASLTRTPSSAGDRRTFTFSCWVKRASLTGANQPIFSAAGDDWLMFLSAETLGFNTSGSNYRIVTNQVFKDTSTWFHVVLRVDTTNATAGDRLRLYINGSEITDFGTDTNPPLNFETAFNNTGEHRIGKLVGASQYFDGYLTEINHIDGQSLGPDSFGQLDASTNRWIPKDASGLTFGTNGFYLDMETAPGTGSGAGTDSSGNGNNFTETGLAAADQVTDSPTENFCVLNPLIVPATMTFTDGNLALSGYTAVTSAYGTFGMSSGKWYWELVAQTNAMAGVAATPNGNQYPGQAADSYSFDLTNGTKYNNGSSSAFGAGSVSAGDTVGVAFDADSGDLKFYDNSGTLIGTAFSGLTSGPYFPVFRNGSAANISVNFGQKTFSHSLPTGHVELNNDNLPLSNGDLSAFVWIKNRDAADNHMLFDAVRGATKDLHSNSTAAEVTNANTLTRFLRNGFEVSNNAEVNTSGESYVAWQWLNDSLTTSSNTDGSITSTVSANTTSGFSIVSYAGNLSTTGSATVGHGLGIAPSVVISKSLDSTAGDAGGWSVQHTSLPASNILRLNTTAAYSNKAGNGTLSSPTSTVFYTNYTEGLNVTGNDYIAYCFAEIPDYSSFGGYTGNGSTDGPFIYTGFAPAFVATKRTNAAGDWKMWDNERGPYNVNGLTLAANASGAESSGVAQHSDFLSNGFKIRGNDTETNGSGSTYIYMAFAENPFGGDGVAPATAR